MNRAVIFVGRDLDVEHYSLMINRQLTFAEYRSGNKSKFLDEITEAFSRNIVGSGETLEVGIIDGYKFVDCNICKADRIENTEEFRLKLVSKISRLAEGRAVMMSAASMN